MNDLRFALRQLFRNAGWTAVGTLTLALGIGANTAIFSVIKGVLLEPLPYPEPDRLVTLWERSPERGIDLDRVSGPNYLDWRAQNSVFSELAVTPAWEGSDTFNLVLGDGTVKVHATYASASLFTTLGVRPWLGRALLEEDDQHEGPTVAVLGHGLWQRAFAGASNVLGRTLTIDTYGRRDYTIVGVMPPGFGLPGRNELWLPMGWMDVTLNERRSAHWHHVIGRLKPGVTLEGARAELTSIQRRLREAYPGEAIGSEVAVVPLLDQALGRNLRTALWVLWGVVAGVLLIGCANLANLMLARAVRRQQEIAVRLALGAGRWRVVRQLLIESLMLAGTGGALGLLVGWCGLRLFVAWSPGDIPRLADVDLDWAALGFTLSLSMLTGLFFGLVPAWQCSRTAPNEVLKDGSRRVGDSRATGRIRHGLVVGEVAVSLVLLAGAGLMLQSFARMLRVERGFEPAQLITAELDFSVSGFTGWTQPTPTRPQVALWRLIERLRAVPGVKAVGAGSRLLRRDNHPANESIALLGRPAPVPEEPPKAHFLGVSPEWRRALGLRLVDGRDFTEADTLTAPGVVLVNEAFARRHLRNVDPVGQYLKMGTSQPPQGATNVWGLPEWSRIVGVLSDVTSLDPRPEASPEIYVSYWQWPMQSPTLLIRARGNRATLAATIRREVRAVIPNVPPPSIRTMEEVVSQSIAQPRLQAALLGLFALLALAMTAVGLFGVVALTVGERTREFGIRIALGAQRGDVLALVMRQGVGWVGVGLGVGLLLAVALARVMRRLLYGVTPADPPTLAVVTLVLGFIALLACWIPARRATRVDPMQVLRDE